jgi:iron(III) transport system ATP-binding protein
VIALTPPKGGRQSNRPTMEAMDEPDSAPVAAEPVIALRGLTKRFGDLVAVEDLDLEVAQGEIMGILGPSGCGKTTTLRLIAGFEEPNRGSVWLNGQRVAGEGSWRPPEKRAVGVVFQDYALFPHLNVAANVSFGLQRVPRSERKARLNQMLEVVGLTGLEKRYPHQLSGGQRQRVALARALAPLPVVLLLDEPFSNLDAEMRGEVRLEVRSILKRLGATAVFVTHDQEEAFVFADCVAVMNNGRLEQVDHPEALYNRPATRFVADFVGHGNFLPATLANGLAQTELGEVRIDGGSVEGSARILVRPHDIALFAARNGRTLVVRERRFLGSEVEYVLELPSGRTIISHQPPEADFQPGDLVGYELREENLRVFQDQASDSAASTGGTGSSS